MTLADIRDYIKTLGVGENFSIGKIDVNKQKSIGIYQRPDYGTAQTKLGGLSQTKTLVKQISILIHWDKNAKNTETNAMALYDALLTSENVTINNKPIDYIDLRMPEPADLGTDDLGIYERVIWADFYYQK